MSAILVDSNVLVYGYDPRDTDKQLRAQAVLEALNAHKLGVLSVQCLTEFYQAVRWRLPDPLTPEDALGQVERLAQAFPVLNLTPSIVLAACRASGERQLSIWDALIWAAAKLNDVRSILTEDAPQGRLLEGIRYFNPFDPAFDLALLDAQQ